MFVVHSDTHRFLSGTFVSMRLRLLLVLVGLAAVFTPSTVAAAPSAEGAAASVQTNLDFVWMIVAAALVFFMQAGFALLEAGFTQAKNAVNIIMKNVTDASVGGLVFFAVGFALMFGPSWNGLVGTGGFFLTGIEGQSTAWTYGFFFFQAVFAATAATIVSGAWAWGGLFNGSGWLEQLGFIDFAGSTVVHSIGGWAALAGALVVGPRLGKYDEDGAPQDIPAHNLPLAALGVFILWLGWFGFNAGSTTAGTTSIALIATNTFLSAGAGAVGATITTALRTGVARAPMALNGVLAGLVGITAGCATLTPGFAALTGLIAGVIVVYAMHAIERIADDPVGAVAVHGVCGAWGTLAAGLFNVGAFSLSQVAVQLIGIGAAFSWAFPTSYAAFTLADALVGVTLTEAVEEKGLDMHEHDTSAYPDFEEVRADFEQAHQEALQQA